MGRIGNAFTALRKELFAPQNSTLANPDKWLVDAVFGSAAAAGVRVSPLAAMGIPTVYACVNARARALSSIPLKLYRRTSGGGKEVASDHPLYWLLHDAPNEEMTSADFRRAIFANAALRNNGYALIVRDGLQRVREIYPIANKDIYPERENGTNRLFYMLNSKRIEANQILHLRGLTFDGAIGLDAVSVARDAIGLAIALQDHASKYFPNSVSPSVSYTIPTFLKPDQLEMLRAEIDKRAGGAANAHRPLILQGGATANGMAQPDNQKGQFIEAKKYQDKAICQIFGVPQSKAGIMDDAHYDNVEQDNGSFVTDTLMPDAVQCEQALNQRLLGPIEQGKYFFQFEFSGLMRAKLVERMQAHKIAIEAGISNRNEVRITENMNPVEGGDNFVISQNVQLLDKDGTPVPKPAPVSTESQSQQTA